MITKKQKEVLDFITERSEKQGYAPSLEEIASHFKLQAVSTAHHHVAALEKLGYVRRRENHPRALQVMNYTATQTKAKTSPKKADTSIDLKQAINSMICGDALDVLKRIPDDSVDLIVADPPYNLSQGNTWSWSGEGAVPGFGGKWSKVMEAWDNRPLLDYFTFTLAWLGEAKRVLKPTGSLWVFGTYHNIGAINMALQILDVEIINEIVWYKRNAFPNLSGRRFTASHETILWAHAGGKKRKYFFDYDSSKDWNDASDLLKKEGKQMRTVWDVPNNKAKDELRFGKHPTQKPLSICKRIIALSSPNDALILSPFAGVGSECVAAKSLGRKYIGIEMDQKYVDVAEKRLAHVPATLL